ncbi:MAG: Phospho-N-acetylmuramoyl-pentapeptide-transferase [Bacillota bacterium]|jgi:phospho-N-acetylmuramoyl-pentapeptide-transferase|nr:Phospho-N-acetylmuramoyl-pentapeptide-transferase [Bacillota bacterium]
MIFCLNNIIDTKVLLLIGILFTFFTTCLLLYKFSGNLPKDKGRDYAHDGKLSAGKPRGAGFIFIIVFILTSILFTKIDKEIIVYLIYVVAAMLIGFLDDCSKTPWNEYKKGLFDLIISIMTSVSFLYFNSSEIQFDLLKINVTINPIIFTILATILIWLSINVTNCSDGVDGLSGILSIATLITVYILNKIKEINPDYNYLILIFCICILGYLWYNISPSSMIMGDAGSRAMGIFIAISILKTGSPLLFIPVALLLILDGGLGLFKVSMLRFFKLKVFVNIRTPLHDHVRKSWNWSNTQVVFRFVTIQILISMAVIYISN